MHKGFFQQNHKTSVRVLNVIRMENVWKRVLQAYNRGKLIQLHGSVKGSITMDYLRIILFLSL